MASDAPSPSPQATRRRIDHLTVFIYVVVVGAFIAELVMILRLT